MNAVGPHRFTVANVCPQAFLLNRSFLDVLVENRTMERTVYLKAASFSQTYAPAPEA